MQAVMAEDWAPRRQVVHDVYKEDVLRCPIYLGLFWRVFSDPTVREYEVALTNANVEMLLYVKDCPDAEREEPLQHLLRRLEESHVPKYYRSAAELMAAVPRHLDEAVERMVEKLVGLATTVRSARGPRALKTRREQKVLLDAWGLGEDPDEAVSLLMDARRGLQERSGP
jgi:hypothetical protein